MNGIEPLFFFLALFGVGGFLALIVSVYLWRRWRQEAEQLSTILQKAFRGENLGRFPRNSLLASVAKMVLEHLEVQRQDLQKAQREREQWLEIAQSLAEGLILVGLRGEILWANPAAEKILGLPIRTGQWLQEILREEKVLKAFWEASSETVEFEIFWPEPREVALRVVPLNHTRVLFLEDKTLFKRLAQVRRDFVANLAHEIRTPLTAIAGYAESLLSENLDDHEWVREQLVIILRHARRLGKLVQDLLLLSTLETRGIPEEEKEIFSLQEILGAAHEAVAPQARDKGLQIRLLIPRDPPCLVRGHYDLLVQAVINLLDNAVKFSPSREKVQVFLREEGSFWVIAVKDQGPGIPTSERERLFERFYRGKKIGPRGAGLGLALVKHIVLAHEGRVEVESEPGVGSCFRIYLPKGIDYLPLE